MTIKDPLTGHPMQPFSGDFQESVDRLRAAMAADTKREVPVPANEYGPWDYARASLVRYAYPGNGWPDDRERAAELLTPGDVYAVSRCTVGDSVTRLELMGKPGSFNSVLFEPVPDEEAGQ